MVKVFALIPKRPDVTERFFHEHWAGPHADLALRITTLRRYVQSHRVRPGLRDLPESPYEGIAEVWFDDAATAAGMAEDPDYTEHAHLDEPNFIDTDRLGFVMTEERVLRAGPLVAKDDPGAKLMLLLRRRPELDPATFARRVDRIDELVPDAARATVAPALPESYADGAEPAYDAIVELWFADRERLDEAWDRSGGGVLEALDAVADCARSAGFAARELRVIWPQSSAPVVA